jgi:Cu+-exporting ATPase
METVNWKVEGMSCSACAQTINGFLEKKGMKDVQVSLAAEAKFLNVPGTPEPELKKRIENLGYHIADESAVKKYPNKFARYLAICVPSPFSCNYSMQAWAAAALASLLLGAVDDMFAGLHNGYFFGRSAINSIKLGTYNMNVLIALGATAAFMYSLSGTLLNLGESFQFYETSAAIITLVFFGNYLEERSLRTTQKALNSLLKTQKVTANMIAFDDRHEEIIFPVDSMQVKSGDLLLIRSGEQVPADSKILWGEGQVDEAIITGESFPVIKKKKDQLIGGSILIDGNLKVQVTAAAKDSVISNIVDLVKRAQSDKPKIQLLITGSVLFLYPLLLASRFFVFY